MSKKSFQGLSPTELKKFENYLDSSGVTDVLGNALYNLSSEPVMPENPRQYLIKQLEPYSGKTPDLLQELKKARAKLAKLKKENKELRERVARKLAIEAARQKLKREAVSNEALENHEYNQDVYSNLI